MESSGKFPANLSFILLGYCIFFFPDHFNQSMLFTVDGCSATIIVFEPRAFNLELQYFILIFLKIQYFTYNNTAQRLKEGFRDERRAQIMVTLHITLLLYVEVQFLDLNEIG